MLNRSIILIYLLCSFPISKAEEIKNFDFQYNLKKYDAFRIYLDCKIGNLSVEPSNNRYYINGDVSYNSLMSKPDLKLSDKNNVAKLDFKIKTEDIGINSNSLNSLIDKGSNNYVINFLMPKKISTDLNFNFGAGQVDLDFSGLRITSLIMDCGLSDVNLICDKSNIVHCESVNISTGVSDFNSTTIGNFNSPKYYFNVGVGSAQIDMSGSVNKDTKVKIDVTLGSLELKLPENTNIELMIDQNLLSSINIRDLVSLGEGKYKSKETQKRWATMELEISVGIGSADIYLK